MAHLESPSTELYTIGKGILTIGKWTKVLGVPTPPDPDDDMYDMGDVSDCKMKPTIEKKDHFSSRGGMKQKDKVAIVQVGIDGSITGDELSMKNLCMFLFGTLTGDSIEGVTDPSAEYAIVFTEDNPYGENHVWTIYRAMIEPAGDLPLISDDWSKVQFNFSALADKANHSTGSAYFNVAIKTA